MFFAQEHLLWFICVGIHLQDFLWRVLTEHDPMKCDIMPFLGSYYHHGTSWYILSIHQCFFLLLYQEACSKIFLVSYYWMLLHPIWSSIVWIIHWLLHCVISPHNNFRWCVQARPSEFCFSHFFHLHHPQFSHVGWTLVGFQYLDIGIFIRVIIRPII